VRFGHCGYHRGVSFCRAVYEEEEEEEEEDDDDDDDDDDNEREGFRNLVTGCFVM